MAHVVVVGAGGNIGSHLVGHLGRTESISRLTLIDRDRYEHRNLASQEIDRRDIGSPKVMVQARRLGRINASLQVAAVHAAVEDVPLGALRADALVACLDSRRARLVVNQSAWRLGVPWIDAGVDADGRLVRVQAYLPREDAPCLECAWDDRDYALVEQRYTCDAAAVAAEPPTRAPSSLGGLAAAIQAIELTKLLTGNRAAALVGRDLVLDATHHRHFVTRFDRNLSCRMPDHDGWRIERLLAPPSAITLGDLLVLCGRLADHAAGFSLRVAGQRLALTITCNHCGTPSRVFRLERWLGRRPARCMACRRALSPSGFELFDEAPLTEGLGPMLRASLSTLGVEKDDVLSIVSPSAEAHFHIGG